MSVSSQTFIFTWVKKVQYGTFYQWLNLLDLCLLKYTDLKMKQNTEKTISILKEFSCDSSRKCTDDASVRGGGTWTCNCTFLRVISEHGNLTEIPKI